MHIFVPQSLNLKYFIAMKSLKLPKKKKFF